MYAMMIFGEMLKQCV